jgi:predicted nuclease of predicted toxin-antitoxin system
VKLLLDEMWTPTIAQQLRKRAHDVWAIKEPDRANRYAGVPDDEVFATAQEDGLTILTDNIGDYEHARLTWESRGRPHHGLVYALNPPFNRHQGEAVIGQMVKALDRFLSSPDAATTPYNRVHYLREAR